jgi:hypothetical protein
MNLKRLRDPLVAALGALLIAGVSVAMANESTPSNTTTTSVEEQAEAPDAEADGPGGHEDPAGDVDHQFEGEE